MEKYVTSENMMRRARNDRARKMNHPLPHPAEEIPGGVDPIFQRNLSNMVYILMERYDWDKGTALRALSNMIDDLAPSDN